MKKAIILAVSVLLTVLIIVGIWAVTFKNNKSDPEIFENNVGNQVGGDTEADPGEQTFASPVDFEPFECSGKYYDFSSDNKVQNQHGMVFQGKNTKDSGNNCNAIVYSINGEASNLFSINNTNVDVRVLAFIDDALYFRIDNSADLGIDGLYRIWFTYDEKGDIYNSGLSFCLSNELLPVQAKDNVLILEKDYDHYVALNTLTGEMNAVDFNVEVDADTVKNISVSLEAAMETAEKELKKDEYRFINGNEISYVPNIDGIDPVLIKDPNLIYHQGYENHRFEDYPEYVWVIRYDSEPLYQQVRIYVNAQSGRISNIQIQPYP